MPTSKRADKKPAGDYGDVKYADPGYQEDRKPRYPIDTEEHIKAAWNYINKESNASQYSAADAAKVKAHIISAWKEKIDPEGPPSARAVVALLGEVRDAIAGAPPVMQRGLYTAAWFLMWLADGYELTECVAQEEALEGDGSPAPAALLSSMYDLGKQILAYASEQVAEKAAGEDDDDDGLDGSYMMAAPPAERREMLPKVLRALEDHLAPEAPCVVQIGSDVVRIFSEVIDRAERVAQTRSGRVLSADNEATLNEAHDIMTRGCAMVRSVIDRATSPIPEEVDEPAVVDRASAAPALEVGEVEEPVEAPTIVSTVSTVSPAATPVSGLASAKEFVAQLRQRMADAA